MNPSISIIVAIYNAENYLKKCLNSILKQTFPDFELLLIDDGSPDRSGAICDEYAANDSRIKVFHKNNGGVSSARQCGMNHAIGEYVIHVDPDDWIEPNMLEKLYKTAQFENSDIVFCDYFINKNNDQRYVEENPNSKDCDVILHQLMMGTLSGYLWNKLVRKKCYDRLGIQFLNMIMWEDKYVICRLFLQSLNISYLNHAFYHYDQSSNQLSVTRTPSQAKVKSQELFISEFEHLLDKKSYEKEFFHLKVLTKELAWETEKYSKREFINLYPEVNSFFIKNYNGTISLFDNYIGMALRFSYRLSKCVYLLRKKISQLRSLYKKS